MNEPNTKTEIADLRDSVRRLKESLAELKPRITLALALAALPRANGRPAKADIDAAIARIVPAPGSVEGAELKKLASKLYDSLFPFVPA